ncbi:MAG: nuclear transport factor 2 family protein [Croceibacterium sp.]
MRLPARLLVWPAFALIGLLAPSAPAVAGDRETELAIANLEAQIAATRLRIERVKAYDAIENLESAYGYYLDKNLWNDLADLFASDGSMELAQRGVYVGQDHIRAFLPAFGGSEGPTVNRLSNHLNLQPVITVSPDGKTAKVRLRLLQMMGQADRSAGWGGAVYENELINENGVWKFQVDHAYNTYNVDYSGGWSKKTSSRLPGQNQAVPPDRPPTLEFEYFPKVYDIPIHYDNPVTGR